MIKFTIGGKSVDPKNIKDAMIAAVLENLRAQITEKIGSIRDPDTGEFPTVIVRGDSTRDREFVGCWTCTALSDAFPTSGILYRAIHAGGGEAIHPRHLRLPALRALMAEGLASRQDPPVAPHALRQPALK